MGVEYRRLISPPLEGHRDKVSDITITPNRNNIVSKSDDNTIRIWDLNNGKLIRTIKIESYESRGSGMVMTPDSKRIICGSIMNLSIWDLDTGTGPQFVMSRGENIGMVHAVALTSNGKLIISGSQDSTIRVWDSDTRNQIRVMVGHGAAVTAIAITPDDKYIVSGSYDNTIRIWDLKTGDPIGKPIQDIGSKINALSISPNGKCIIGVLAYNAVCVYDFWTGTLIRKLVLGRRAIVNTAAVTLDGKHVVIGLDDGSIFITDIDTCETKTIHAIPLSVFGLDFSKAIISTPELKEQLRQNGAKV